MPDILDPSALLALLPSLLSGDPKTLASQQDGIVALIHTVLVALSFRLTGVEGAPPNVLPADWNKIGPGHYTLSYKHDQSSMGFVVNVSKLGNRTVINAIAVEVSDYCLLQTQRSTLHQSDKVASLDISTDDFTSKSFYPHTIGTSNNQPLVHGFISSHRVSDFVGQFKLKIISKLVPGLQKEGYTETSEASTSSSARPLQNNPRVPNPRPDAPPDAPEGETYPYRQPRNPRNPLEIGRRDLDPFPSNPFAPPSLFPGGGDGMFVGPDHPIFGAGRGVTPPGVGPWGGDGFLPPMGAPPGARFDPVGPGFGPLGGGRGRLRRQDPDNDEFMPPGMVSIICSDFLDI